MAAPLSPSPDPPLRDTRPVASSDRISGPLSPTPSMLTPLLLASLAPLQQAAPATPPAEPKSLVTVDLTAAGLGLRDLARAHFDVAFRRPDTPIVEIVAGAEDRERLEDLGIAYTVVHEDLAAFYASRLDPEPTSIGASASLGAFLSPPFGQGSMGGYYTFSELESVLDQIVAAYPTLTSKFSIGQSLEGRELWAVKISDNPGIDESEPEARFDALHHAREPQSLHTTIWFMLWLLENYGTEPGATYLVDNREIFCVPAVNPDGYVYNEQTNPNGGGLWRKNRRDNGNGTFGVDLNRNYAYQWGFDDTGSSPVTSDETYRGPSAASEPEVQAMQAFISGRDFVTALSTHTYSNLWLHPWGYTAASPPNVAEYTELSTLATLVNAYVFGPASIVLYLANGVTVDYDEGVHGIYSWTPEIGSSADGFWPPTSRIVPLAQENELAFITTAWAAGPFVNDNGTVLLDAGDGDGFFEPGEDVEIVVTVRNSGAAAAASVDLVLSTSSPDAVVAQDMAALGPVGSFASADNNGAPLSLSIDGGASAGTPIPFTVSIQYDGHSEDVGMQLVVGQPKLLAFDDAELELGWTVGLPGDTASTGLWEYGDPVGTTSNGAQSNPEDDATPGPGVNCFTTGNGSTSAGGDDVDDGLTTLITPAFHLSGVSTATLTYQRWFANLTSPDDVFQVAISDDDGATWVPLENVSTNQNSWTEVSFQVEDFVSLTDEVRVRFIAEDDPNNSLVEAAVDELSVTVYESDKISVYGTPAIGTPFSMTLLAEPGDAYSVFASPQTANIPLAGITGTLLIAPGSMFKVAKGTIPGSGVERIVPTAPNSPGLVGKTFYLQALFAGGSLRLSNRDQLTFE